MADRKRKTTKASKAALAAAIAAAPDLIAAAVSPGLVGLTFLRVAPAPTTSKITVRLAGESFTLQAVEVDGGAPMVGFVDAKGEIVAARAFDPKASTWLLPDFKGEWALVDVGPGL